MDVIHGPFKTELLPGGDVEAFVSVTKWGCLQNKEVENGRMIQNFYIFLLSAPGLSCQGLCILTKVFQQIFLFSQTIYPMRICILFL